MFIGTDNEMDKVGLGRSLTKWKKQVSGSDIEQLVAMWESGNSVARASIIFNVR